jgi:hypothetical protein
MLVVSNTEYQYHKIPVIQSTEKISKIQWRKEFG